MLINYAVYYIVTAIRVGPIFFFVFHFEKEIATTAKIKFHLYRNSLDALS